MKRRQATTLLNGQRTRGNDAARHEQRARVAPPERVIEQSTPLPGRQMKDAWAERNQEQKEKNSAGPVKRYVRLREPLWGAKRSAKRLSDAEFVSAMEDSAAGGSSGPRTEISRWRITTTAPAMAAVFFIEPLIAGAPASEGGRYRSKALPTRRSFVDSELATRVLVVKR